LMILWS